MEEVAGSGREQMGAVGTGKKQATNQFVFPRFVGSLWFMDIHGPQIISVPNQYRALPLQIFLVFL